MTDERRNQVEDVPDFDEDEAPLESPAPPRAPSQVYSLRIPVDKLELLRQLASEHNELPSALMRRWILERLETAAPDEPSQGGEALARDHLVDRVIDLEQQVARHQKELDQKAGQHQRELETVVEQVIGAISERFVLRPKETQE